jgi:hypothetical protein
MKSPFTKPVAAAVGVAAALVAVAVFVTATMAGGRAVPVGVGWAVPLVSGGAVGLLSWFLLSGSAPDGGRSVKRTPTFCASCGAEVLEAWRICPYCGGSNEPAQREMDATGVST